MRRLLLVLGLFACCLPASRAPAHAASGGLEYARAAAEAEAKRDFAQAATLYGQAVEAGGLSRDQLRDVHQYRGNCFFFLGRYDEAAAEYRASLDVDSTNVHAALWLYLAMEHRGQNGEGELARRSATLDLFYWPGPVVAFFRGEGTPEDVIKAAADPFLGRRGQLDQLCEAYFYVGERLLLRGRKAEAAAMFRKAIGTGSEDFVEYQAAKAQLAALGP